MMMFSMEAKKFCKEHAFGDLVGMDQRIHVVQLGIHEPAVLPPAPAVAPVVSLAPGEPSSTTGTHYTRTSGTRVTGRGVAPSGTIDTSTPGPTCTHCTSGASGTWGDASKAPPVAPVAPAL